MNRIESILTTLTFTAAILLLPACSGTNRLGKAKKSYDVGEYARAISALDKAYRREKNRFYKGEASFYLAESYRMTNQPRRAAMAYGRAIRFGYTDRTAKLQQARQMLKNGDHEEALLLFEEYLAEVAGDQLAYNGRASARLAMDPPEPKRYEIEAIRKLNSRNSDYAPTLAPDDPSQIYFSSMRNAGKKRRQVNKISGQGTSVIYNSIQDSRGDWQDPEFFLNQEMDGSFEDGTISLTEDGRDAYFTRTRYEKTEPMGAEIWTVKRVGGRWSEPVEVDLGADTLIFAHPAISRDGSTLYFASDMPGGLGGNDLWKVERVGDAWGTPVNLGLDINTAGDEMFPSVRDDGTLYFSSDGLVGFGGLDIFRAEALEDNRWKVANMGQPINSNADDLGITFYPNREAGFFSSSRDNPRGYENIFSFLMPVIQPVVAGNIKTENEKDLPRSTTVRMVGTDGTNRQIEVEPAGVFNFLLEPGHEYTMLISAPGYFNHRERVSTKGLTESRQFDIHVALKSAERPLIFNNLQFDAGAFNLKPQAEAELDKIVALLNDNPTLNLQISAHTDGQGDETDLLILSQQRAEEVLKYLTEKGVPAERLTARGYGGAQPARADANMARQHLFLRENDELSQAFIQRLNRGDQTTARQLNNRVEFSIIR
jgi:peptidoglycan-associated lipoprotein